MLLKINIQQAEPAIDTRYIGKIFSKLSVAIEFSENKNDNPEFDVFSNTVNFRNGEIIEGSNADVIVQKLCNTFYPVQDAYELLAIIQPNEKELISLEKAYGACLVVLRQKSCSINFETFTSTYDIRNRLGKIYLAGAGPGGFELLTIKTLKLLHEADIVFYDNLITNDILEEIEGEKVFVGKQAGNHCHTQSEINQLLLHAAFKYKTIVRLKGGDPTIFGHAGEEFAYLESRFVPVEIVPGITSALAAAAVSATPLTLRAVSQSVAFCSGHEKTSIQVPATDTLVYFMSASNLRNIARELLKNGLSPQIPMKLVYNAGGSDQNIYSETIESLIESKTEYKSPLLTIIGSVADKRKWDKAFVTKNRILYTGTHPDNYAHLGYVTHHPMIKISALPDNTEADTVIKKIQKFEMLIFTSAYSVQFFFERLQACNCDSRCLSGIQIVSIGTHTSTSLKQYGIIPDFQPEDESSEGIYNLLKTKSIHNTMILMPRSDKAQAFLPGKLRELGNEVLELKIYTNVLPENPAKLNPDSFDEVIFTSPSGVENFVGFYGKLPDTRLISKGKETLKALIKFGYRPE